MNTQHNTIELSGPASLIAAMGLSLSLVAIVTLTVSSLAMLFG